MQTTVENNRGRPQPDAFARMDLLVTLAVIMVLAVPLLAATTRNQALAQQLQCAGNLRQLQIQASLYVADNGKLISYNGPSGGSASGTPYLWTYNAQATNYLNCPSAPNAPIVLGLLGQGSADQYWLKTFTSGPALTGSVGFNGWFYSDNGGDGGISSSGYFANSSAVKFPGKSPVFFDENWINTWPTETDFTPGNLYLGYSFSQHSGYEMGRLTIVRHGALSPSAAPRNLTGNPVLPGAVNMSFFDGHVELVRLENFWTYYWNAASNPRTSGHPPVQ
jgi:prepilin-type processing-associated H-X9-DG protein